MEQSLHSYLGGLFLEEAHDEVLSLVGDAVPLGGGKVELGCLDRHKDLVVVVAVEGWVATQENVGDNADAETSVARPMRGCIAGVRKGVRIEREAVTK